MLVALTDPIHPAGEALLRDAGHAVELPAEGGLPALLARAEAVVVRRNLPPDLCAGAPRLLAAVRQGVGVDMIPVANCTAHGVLVANVPGANADAVAEYVVAQMLARRARHGADGPRAAGPRGWAPSRARSDSAFELRGRTLGIVGVGAIGARLAEIAGSGLRMRVLGFRRDRAAMPPAWMGALDDLFAQADFIALACPLTEETRGLASAARLARMKPGAWIINVARGPVIEEAALLDVLRQGRIGGAALDVFDAQPAGADHPLLSLPTGCSHPSCRRPLTGGAMVRMSTGAAEEWSASCAGARAALPHQP
jgi:D-3-phosphoglycerate dehydrogenase